jgi:hypothetical protein
MSNGAITWVVLGVVIFAIIIFCVVFIFVKRNQYMKEVQGKIKDVFFPEAGSTYSRILDVGLSGHEVAAPKGHHLPRYYFDKANTWNTRYPENPFLGLGFLQVQIATVWHYEDNPEPITSQAVATPHVATSSMIFASIDSAFALVVHELDAELQKTKKQLLDALSSKLSKPLVYGALVVILICSIVALAMTASTSSYVHQIGTQLGVK